jgi:hypothetical protein
MSAMTDAALTILNAEPQTDDEYYTGGKVPSQVEWRTHGLTVLAGLQTRGAIDTAYESFRVEWLAVWDALQVVEVEA